MILIGHRGKHDNGMLPNSMEALKAGLEQGYGIETDFRDLEGNLVLSHDRPCRGASLAEDFFAMAGRHRECMLALNVKSDGIGDLIKGQIEKYNIENYFTFDMSVPQMLEYQKLGLCFFTRQSEYENKPILYEKATGVWIDAFEDDYWIEEELIEKYLRDGKKVCIVSSELHGRQPGSLWDKIDSWAVDKGNLMICTDLLAKAEERWGRVCK